MDVATKVAALAVLAALAAIVLGSLPLIFRAVVTGFNLATPHAKAIAVPSMVQAAAITLMSFFVYAILLLGAGFVAGQLVKADETRGLLGVGALTLGAYLMAQIVAEILRSSVRRALVMLVVAGVLQFAAASLVWTLSGTGVSPRGPRE